MVAAQVNFQPLQPPKAGEADGGGGDAEREDR